MRYLITPPGFTWITEYLTIFLPYPLIQISKFFVGVRPYVCSVCGNSFTRSTSLNKHLRMHNGNRPFKCAACPKIFGSRGDLKRHQIIHSGIKPWICTVCSVPFNRKDKLVRHEKLHSGEPRPFQCYECPTSFSRKEDLTKHIQFHHYKPVSYFDVDTATAPFIVRIIQVQIKKTLLFVHKTSTILEKNVNSASWKCTFGIH